MKQTVQPDARQAQTTNEPNRSRPMQQQVVVPAGHLTQLSVMINSSPRVQPVAQLQNAIQHSSQVQGLMGMAVALGLPAPVQAQAKPEQPRPPVKAAPVQTVDHCPIQRTKKDAGSFIEKNGLEIEANQEAVTAYINNGKNPIGMRRGLLLAWNKNQSHLNVIPTPEDLEPTSVDVVSMEDLSGWHSEDEDAWDLEKIKEGQEVSKLDLERAGEVAGPSGVSEMNFLDAIRLGRQVVKRDDYLQLPIITSLGGHYFEYNNPGTKDIYATPLEEVEQEASSKKKNKSRRKFKRAGTSKDFNWRNLARNLAKRGYKDPHSQIEKMLKFFLSKGKTEELDLETAEAIAAIGSDFMKGSAGGRFHLRQALAAIKSVKSKKGKSGFAEVFSGDKPIYGPAAVGGRALVTSAHERFQLDANLLLGVNNCLINAVAHAALGRMANLGELIRIREQLQNYGEMLIASPENIQLIRQVLGIQNPIQIVYTYVAHPAEDFDGAGPLLTIYHVDENHFTDIMPSDVGGKKSNKKKKKKEG